MSLKVKSGTSVGDAGSAADDSKSEAGEAEKGKTETAGQSESDQDSKDSEGANWDDATKVYIKKLRDEAASHRTKAKSLADEVKGAKEKEKALKTALGIESEDEKPEAKIGTLTNANQELSFRNAVLEMALHNGIGADDLDYFAFLVNKKGQELEDGTEMSDEDLAKIVTNAKRGGKGAANSSVGSKDGKTGAAPNPDGKGGVTLDQFVKMNMTEKSQLYGKSPEVYTQLMQEARKTNRLV